MACVLSSSWCCHDGIIPGQPGQDQNLDQIINLQSGVANLNNKTPVTPDTLFQICSVTKTYTAVLILKLEQEQGYCWFKPGGFSGFFGYVFILNKNKTVIMIAANQWSEKAFMALPRVFAPGVYQLFEKK